MNAVTFVTNFFTLFADTLETNKILREQAENGRIYQAQKTDAIPYVISFGLLAIITIVIISRK